MGTLIFGAGTLLGACLGIVLISLLHMAPKDDEFSDLMHRDGKIATPEDTYRLGPSETRPPTGGGGAKPKRNVADRGLRLAH
jgi:hypothetical protein